MNEENQKKGLGIAAIVLGSISILCCSCFGLGMLFALIGGIFSIICIVKGTGAGRTLGVIAIILNGIGFLLGVYVLVSFIMMINWENVNMETLNQINQINPNNEQEIRDWMQQFFKIDLGGYYVQ